MHCGGAKSKQATAVNRDIRNNEPIVPRHICTLLKLLELPNVPVAAAAVAALHICIEDAMKVSCSNYPYFTLEWSSLSAQRMCSCVHLLSDG